MFEVKNLDVGFSSNILISRINQGFIPGKIYTVLGDNGAGKTTFIKTLTGFIPKVGGSILLNKKSIDTLQLSERAKIFSVLFSKNEIDPMIKVREIFEFSLGINLNKIEENSGLWQFDKIFEISHMLDKSFGSLSDGQRQLILIARALLKKAKIYFLDEPTIYLDLKTKKKLIEYLKKSFISDEKTILMISHDISFVKETSDYILKIEEGILTK